MGQAARTGRVLQVNEEQILEKLEKLVVGKEGRLYLRLVDRGGRTCLSDAWSLMPLRIAKPFYLDKSGELCLYIMNPSGGMVQGDHLEVKVVLEPGAQVLLTTQAAAKIYRMEHDHASATEYFEVGRDALLEYFPDPVIPFAGSRFRGEIELSLDPGSTVLMGEVLFPGRVKRGEIFQFDYFKRRVKVSCRGRIIYYDYIDLRPNENRLDAAGMLEGYIYYGQLLIFSDRADNDLSNSLHDYLQGRTGIMGSASLTCENGIVVRMLARKTPQITQVLTGCWNLARNRLLGLPAPGLRKY